MKLPTLYSRTSTGAIQEWTVEIQGDKYRTHHGQVGGKIVTTSWFVAYPTNVGRANHRDAAEQALFEASATWKRKKDSGCFENISEIDTVLYIEPMLAKKWEDLERKVVFPVFCQPKLDGQRAVITKDGAKTRTGKEWKSIPHILEALKPVFEKYPDLVLDGELYNHDLKDDFNKISSLVKKTKPSPADLQESAETIQYHWYDIVDTSLTFSQRDELIDKLHKKYLLNSCIARVATYVARDKEELDVLYGEFLNDGYEGQMIRLDTPYVNKRTASLLKRKEFQDDEYKIVEICRGNGNRSEVAGYAWMEREDGVRFRSNIKGDRAFLRDLLENAEQYSGSYATVKYFNLTPDGIPRFPYIIRLRANRGED
jgi:DNA ligase-1